MHPITRRSMLSMSAIGALALRTASAAAPSDVPSFSVDSIRTISLQSDRYHGWPTLCRLQNGELLVVCSGGRDSHICPMGRVELIRSFDDGETWTYARTLLDGPLDDRDAGIVETPQGTLLATTFTSLAYLPNYQKVVAQAQANEPLSMPKAQLERWSAAYRRVPAEEQESHLGCWMLRSQDGGLNWSAAYRVPVNSPHGPIVLNDGTLFYAGVALWEEGREVAAFASTDDGMTWEKLANFPVRAGDNHKQYHELHAVEAADGRLVVHIRNHNKPNAGETLQTHSTDGGKSWATPYSIGVWGLPSHLLRMSDDRLLMTYGHRRAPLGNQARVSADHGQTWSAAIPFHADATSGDLGYPSTVEIAPQSFVTVWYEATKENPLAQLRMAKWRLN
ncbi:sialidase family protein [Aureliella helgolandensis]|uniref:BNR/Asp-box repeat protein n=1 Tax=Aureliella helgolandensis TaxID=2527968 RepID=A0A518GAG1_9BACT|nr:sialidase family protein [Aureliella helgolandensis]QDV25577.1 BNR/Asp-box repeat protein [Aureliella helgolandensis]